MKSQPISARVCKAKIRNLGIRERVGRSAPRPYRVKTPTKYPSIFLWNSWNLKHIQSHNCDMLIGTCQEWHVNGDISRAINPQWKFKSDKSRLTYSYRVSHKKVYLLNILISQPPTIAQRLFSTRNLCLDITFQKNYVLMF